MKKIFFVLFMVALLSIQAQMGSIFANPSFAKPDFSFSSILNPNKLSMTHSVSFSSGISSNRTGFYQSVYTNHIKYKFNPKFTLNLDLNFINTGSGSLQNKFQFKTNNDNSSFVVPNLKMTYKPSENTTISFQFSKAVYINNNFNSSTPQNFHWRW